SGGSFNLGAGLSQVVTVQFQPTVATPAQQSGSVTVSSNGVNGGAATVTVTGNIVFRQVLQVSPTALTFGAHLGEFDQQTFTFTNSGGGALTGSASFVAPFSGPFSIFSGSSFNLGAGQSQVVTVQFQPTVANPGQMASVTVSSNGGPPVTVTLSGDICSK